MKKLDFTTAEFQRVFNARRRLIDKELMKIFSNMNGVSERLLAAMRYAVFSPGKRLRPILMLESFRACGGREHNWIMPFCCGIELIHTFSLIHDDLPAMDNDDFRRGLPTLHRKFDEGTAILAADALFALAYETFTTSPAPPENKIEAIATISRAVGPEGMAAGQMLDLERMPDLRYVARLKTAELIAASLEVGAIIATASRLLQKRLRQLGLILGILFQLTDDLLDSEQDARLSIKNYQKIQKQISAMAARAQKGLLRLGPHFSFLAQFPAFVLYRKG